MNIKRFEFDVDLRKTHWKQWVFILARHLLYNKATKIYIH